MEEHDDIEMQVEQLTAKAEEAANEKNRAIAASINAEIRKAKATLLTSGVEGLQKKLKKGKNVTKTLVEERQERLKKLIDAIYNIPDGIGGGKRRGGYAGPGKGGTITLNAAGAVAHMTNNPMYYEHSDATKKFDQVRRADAWALAHAHARPSFFCGGTCAVLHAPRSRFLPPL